MRKIFILLLTALVITLFACGPEEEEYGSLTIKNLPSVPLGNLWGRQLYWVGGIYYDENLTDYYNYQVTEVASFDRLDSDYKTIYSHKSPFVLYDTRRYEGFKDSGTFLVIIFPASSETSSPFIYKQYEAFMSVNFKNGKATIDYNDMTRFNTLDRWPY